MIWDGCRERLRRQVTGLVAKTEEDERRRTGKRTVDLTLNETFSFRLVPQAQKGGDEESRSRKTEKSICGTRDLHAEDGYQDDGLESSTHTITRLRFFWILYR